MTNTFYRAACTALSRQIVAHTAALSRATWPGRLIVALLVPSRWAGGALRYHDPLPRPRNGAITRTYCVITVEPSLDVEPIHDRMPLALEDADLPIWLGEAPGDLTALLRPPPDGVLKYRALGQGSRGRR
jgi:putative SOS response-associated peptidase YedK